VDLDFIALTLVIIGALNWLLVGLFGFNLVAAVCGAGTVLSSIIYVLVGLAGLWCISFYPRLRHAGRAADD